MSSSASLWQVAGCEKVVQRRYDLQMAPGCLCRFIAPDHYHDAISITLWDEEGDEIEINIGDVCTIIEKHEFENDAREPIYDVLYRGKLIGVDECFLETVSQAGGTLYA